MRPAVPLLLLALGAGTLRGQEARAPYLPADHWSRHALLRLAGADALPAIDGARAWPLTRDEVRRLLRAAAGGPDAALAAPLLRLFEAEFGPPEGDGVALSAEGGWAGSRGRLLGGTSVRDAAGSWTYPGPTAVAPDRGADVRAAAELRLGRFTAAAATGADAGRPLDEAWVNAALGPLDLWAGRRSFSPGPAGGALVLGAGDGFDGAGLRTTRTFRLPPPFRFLGAIDAAFVLSRFERSGAVRHPWFGATRIVLSPARRVTVGLNRAALFGGEGNVQATSLRNLLFIVGGLTSQLGKDSGYENQVASIDVRAGFRLGALPLVAHGEVGIDDVGFNLFRTAAFVAGLDLPALPGLPALGLGIEHARIPGSCCTQPPWYRHGDLGDGWTMGGRLLGHPLGGEGGEWKVRASWTAGRARAEAEILARTRGKENLLAPDHGGSSLGGSLNAVLPVARDVVASGSVALERGADGWRVWQARIGVRVRLRVTGGLFGGPASGKGLQEEETGS